MSKSYDIVADVIGQEMDKTWKRILERLANAETNALSNGTNVQVADIQDFFKNLGGAQMAINFSSLTPKGETVRFNAHQLQQTSAIKTMGVSGTISIGVNISF